MASAYYFLNLPTAQLSLETLQTPYKRESDWQKIPITPQGQPTAVSEAGASRGAAPLHGAQGGSSHRGVWREPALTGCTYAKIHDL